MSSTLSVFLKPLTEDLAVSRGLFSVLRSGEILLAGALAPLIGPLVDRYGGRWLMAGGALSAGIGFVLLSQVSAFWQFLLVRWVFVAIGGVLMCQMVVSVTIALVRAQAWARDCDCEPRSRLGQSLDSACDGDAVRLGRLAFDLDRLRIVDFGSGRYSRGRIHAAKPGRDGIDARRRPCVGAIRRPS